MNAFFLLIFSIPTLHSNTAQRLNENLTDVAMLEEDIVTENDSHEESTNHSQHLQYAGVPKISTKLWDFNTIPYVYSAKFTTSEIKLIMSAMEEIEQKTCVRFVRKTDKEKSFIFFNLTHKNGACSSEVGQVGYRQVVNLTPDCVALNEKILHELAHVLGFYHEHNRYDRDKHIQVILENVVPEMRSQFELIRQSEMIDFKFPYDYNSITHYDEYAYSVNGSKTILSKKHYGRIQSSGHLSKYDVMKINFLYKCPGYTDKFESTSLEDSSTTTINEDRDLDIFEATKSEKVERVKMLLNGGSDVNERDRKDKNKTALHFATRTKGRSIMLILLNRSANIEAMDDEGLTPLHYASIDGKSDTAAVLISRGANVDVRSNNNTTPLHFAAKFGHLNCISLLLNNWANIESKDNYGWTPLHVAAQRGYSNVASVLINNLANITATDKVGRLPLHIAASFGHVNVVSLLLNISADIESKDNNAWTPLHYASFQGHQSTVLLLLDKGANVFAKTARNQATALDLARLRNREEVKEILEQKHRQFRLLFLKSYLEAIN